MGACLLVGHDADAEVALRRAELVLQGATAITPRIVGASAHLVEVTGQIREDVAGLPARTIYPIVHLLAELPADAVRFAADVRALSESISHEYPGLVVQDWLVLQTGQRLDKPEEHLARSLVDDGVCQTVLLTASSTEASVAHTPEEHAAFAADAAVLIVTGCLDDLTPGQVRAIGSTSVVYRADDVHQALVAHHLVGVLRDTVLAPIRADDVNLDRGKAFVQELEIGEQADQDTALNAPIDGNVLTWLRIGDIELDDVPIAQWVDRLGSLHDEWAATELRRAYTQIGRNVDERCDELRDELTRAVLAHLHDRSSLHQTSAYVEGFETELDHVSWRVDRIPAPSRDEVDERLRAARDRLAAAVRSHPFGASALVRGAVIVVLLAVLVATIGSLVMDGGPTAWIARLVLALGVVALWSSYLRRRADLLEARDRYADAIEARLEALARIEARTALRRLVERLRRWADGVRAELRVSQELLEDTTDDLAEFARVRARDELLATRFSRCLPDPEDLSTEVLADRFPPHRELDDLANEVVGAVFEDTWVTDRDTIDAAVEALTATIDCDGLWRDLDHLLEKSESTRRRCVQTLASPTVPVISRMVGDGQEVTRRLHLRQRDDGVQRRLQDLLGDHAPQGPAAIGAQPGPALPIDPVVGHLDVGNLAIVLNMRLIPAGGFATEVSDEG